jgi:hypothetical protein
MYKNINVYSPDSWKDVLNWAELSTDNMKEFILSPENQLLCTLLTFDKLTFANDNSLQSAYSNYLTKLDKTNTLSMVLKENPSLGDEDAFRGLVLSLIKNPNTKNNSFLISLLNDSSNKISLLNDSSNKIRFNKKILSSIIKETKNLPIYMVITTLIGAKFISATSKLSELLDNKIIPELTNILKAKDRELDDIDNGEIPFGNEPLTDVVVTFGKGGIGIE